MSLTELSRSPFSLVDEINQGMDQRAERAVHDQMVEVTCKDTASQCVSPSTHMHERRLTLALQVLPHHAQAAAQPALPRAHEGESHRHATAAVSSLTRRRSSLSTTASGCPRRSTVSVADSSRGVRLLTRVPCAVGSYIQRKKRRLTSSNAVASAA